MPTVFFINHFFGTRAETLGAPIIGFAYEQVAAGEAFHPCFATPGDLILRIIAQEQVDTGRAGDVHRIESAFSAFV